MYLGTGQTEFITREKWEHNGEICVKFAYSNCLRKSQSQGSPKKVNAWTNGTQTSYRSISNNGRLECNSLEIAYAVAMIWIVLNVVFRSIDDERLTSNGFDISLKKGEWGDPRLNVVEKTPFEDNSVYQLRTVLELLCTCITRLKLFFFIFRFGKWRDEVRALQNVHMHPILWSPRSCGTPW